MTNPHMMARPSRFLTERLPTWPQYEVDERNAVERALRSGKVNYWTGEEGRAFEREFAASVEVQYGVAVANGTLALQLALKALDIGPGDEVVVTPRSFIASTSVVVLAGATPVFADIDEDSQNITPASITEVLTPNTRAIIPVHLAGWPCDMEGIMQLAHQRNLKVIEDCAQANGASIRGRPVGSFGDVAAFSFCQDKIITTGGEGGMIVTNDREIWERCWSFKDHGKDINALEPKRPGVEFRWLHGNFGSNCRMTELQAAIGRRQLLKLPGWQRRRECNARRLAEVMSSFGCVRVPLPPDDIVHAWYRLYAFVVTERLQRGWTRDRIVGEINSRGVPCFVGSCPEIYLERAFEGSSFIPERRLATAQLLGETAFCLLVHPTLEDEHIEQIGNVIRDVLIEAELP